MFLFVLCCIVYLVSLLVLIYMFLEFGLICPLLLVDSLKLLELKAAYVFIL